MNKTVEEFLEKNNIVYPALQQEGLLKVKSASDVNYIIARNRIFKNSYKKTRISIADILGYEYESQGLTGQDFIYNMSNFFDIEGSGYQARSISMLEYSTDEIVDKLKPSFSREPMKIIEADKGGKYVIGDNGLHRYHVLKAHFLKEMFALSLDDKEGYNALKEKYTFDVSLCELDFTKTYSSYILKKIANFKGESIPYFSAELDQDYNYTGKLKITTSEPENELVLNDEQLIKFVQDRFNEYINDKSISSHEKQDVLSLIMVNYEMFDSFREYCDKNLPELVRLKDKEDVCRS